MIKETGKLPSVASRASIKHRKTRILGPKIYLFLDIETSGFSKEHSEILQIAAVSNCEKMEKFNQYMLPTKGIISYASEANNLTTRNGQLLYKNKKVDAVKAREGLNRFLRYLGDINPHHSKHVILVSHNAPFDLGFLQKHLTKLGLWHAFTNVVSGFIDSLTVFRDLFPRRESYKLKDLALDFTGDIFDDAHEASADAQMLRNLSALLYDSFPIHTLPLRHSQTKQKPK